MPKKVAPLSQIAGFIETMDCLPISKLPEGPEWSYELKLDGYRLEAVRGTNEVTLYSRRRNVLNERFGYIATALEHLPLGTVVDGEIVALGPNGHADFYLLQKYRSAESHIIYYVFDILVLENRDLTCLPLSERRRILSTVINPKQHVALSVVSNRSAAEMLKFAKKHGLEGLVAKRSDSVYQPGKRTGLWSKYRINMEQEFVVGGYVPSHLGLDSLVVGFYRGRDLIYSARVRAGFVPRTRREVFEQIKHLKTAKCPFLNLPETEPGRWGQGLTAEKMKECIWVKPEFVARIDFLEWTGAHHLRHAKFVALRDDKDPRKVVREA
ncbi:MAG: non-homologous end-joining DNA ligase [Silvibacterium sp.]